MEKKIIVLIPYFNVYTYLNECYESLLTQKYKNYELYFLDDASTDGSSSIVYEAKNVKIIRQYDRAFALKNLADILRFSNFNDEDIITIVDGDDFLSNPNVLKIINDLYTETNCLLTYGQYVCSNGVEGHCIPYTRDEFKGLRDLDFRASHLKTFKYCLFREFLNQDQTLNSYRDNLGEYYKMAYDVALMYPLMEIAGFENIIFNNKVLYVYRIHSLNDMNIDRMLQRQIEIEIRAKSPFKKASKW